ncbi:Fur-regulated basic protein FbpA [Alkalicoccobacillus porphyridii]|uniref:Fur-regulated basic protein FbpA n=1 Tax=Alkalicoccobacillus porphyridii TaxID=2597270 RepID=A0A554A384_9BACI|nr:Fur-regulated basic protein FbpA [Alkalicoccobacillus porphyridii]TSB48152.1 Fur-regulated basic protein FbpA [Alkalicoccobacillus porphyridii]
MNQQLSPDSDRRDHLIARIIELGVFKLKNRHLFELSMAEIDQLYTRLMKDHEQQQTQS